MPAASDSCFVNDPASPSPFSGRSTTDPIRSDSIRACHLFIRSRGHRSASDPVQRGLHRHRVPSIATSLPRRRNGRSTYPEFYRSPCRFMSCHELTFFPPSGNQRNHNHPRSFPFIRIARNATTSPPDHRNLTDSGNAGNNRVSVRPLLDRKEKSRSRSKLPVASRARPRPR